jgi:hypothetical protein
VKTSNSTYMFFCMYLNLILNSQDVMRILGQYATFGTYYKLGIVRIKRNIDE